MSEQSNLTFMSFSFIKDGLEKKIDADTVVRIVKENGISMMDIMDAEFQIFGEEKLKAALKKYDVRCGCLITGFPFYEKTPEELQEEIERALRLAKSLNVEMLMVIPGRYTENEQRILKDMTREQMLETAVCGYRQVIAAAKKYGISVGFENTPHDKKPLASAEDCEYLLKQVPGLGLIFDTGNFRVADTSCDEVEIYEKLKKYIVRVHLKDVVVGAFESGERCTDGNMIRCVPSGSGIIPMKELLYRMQKDGYDGKFSVEYSAPQELHGEEHIEMVKIYVDYITACLSGKPFQTQYGEIRGVEKPVSRMFFGTANLPMLMGKNVHYLLDAAMTYGINAFDTARGYGAAENSLGQWIKDRNNRERVVILSKCGNCAQDGTVCVNREVIEKELEESLQALQTDYIDIYLLHRDDPNTPVSEIIDTLNDVQKAGKIKIFGVSNWRIERINEANTYASLHHKNGFAVSSPNFGLAEQIADPWGGDCVTITGEDNAEARDWYRKSQMPVLAYSSLARGLMTGKIQSKDEEKAAELLDPFCVKGYVCHENFERLARCEELAEKKGCSVSQLAVGWMFTQGLNLYTLISTTKAARLKENLQALYIKLSQEESEYLNLTKFDRLSE